MHYSWESWYQQIIEIAPGSILGLMIVLLIEVLVQGRDNSVTTLLNSKGRNYDLLGWFVFLTRLNPLIYDFILLGAFIRMKGPIQDNSLQFFLGDSVWSFTISLILGVLVYDFFQYWAHRIKHGVTWFWIGHRWHHSTTNLNAFSHMRGHTIDYITRTLCVAFPTIYIMGPSFESVFWLWVAEDVSQALAHSRINTDYGLMGKIFCSPRYHRRHHSIDDPRCNYGLIFSFWDKIFGTYKDESRAFEMPTGTEYTPDYESQGALKAYFNELRNFLVYPFEKARLLLRLPKNNP